MQRHACLPTALIIVLLCACPVLAQTVINQSKAMAGLGGCDAPGFPVTICKSGSYKLTSNLTVPNANTTAIDIVTDDVTVDLNGFAILGPTVCSGFPPSTPVTCNPVAPSGIGVRSINGCCDRIAVVNGLVRGMSTGILFDGSGNRIDRVNVANNAFAGISVGIAHVTNTTAMFNGAVGIFAANGSTVSGNISSFNGGDGIRVSVGSTVTGNTVASNRGVGIFAHVGSTVSGNTVRGNGGVGLDLQSSAGYSNNVISANFGGEVSGGVQMGTNVCGTDTI